VILFLNPKSLKCPIFFITLHSQYKYEQKLKMLLPISAAAKGVLWTVLFGLAKTCQYGGITILGVDGYNRVKNYFRGRKK